MKWTWRTESSPGLLVPYRGRCLPVVPALQVVAIRVLVQIHVRRNTLLHAGQAEEQAKAAHGDEDDDGEDAKDDHADVLELVAEALLAARVAAVTAVVGLVAAEDDTLVEQPATEAGVAVGRVVGLVCGDVPGITRLCHQRRNEQRDQQRDSAECYLTHGNVPFWS